MASSRLKRQILDPDKARVIRLQANLVREEHFFLAGGIGLALRLGHRLSADLDWFTPTRFDAGNLQQRLEDLEEKPSQILRHGKHTVRAYYGTLETSFISYEQVPAQPVIGLLHVDVGLWRIGHVVADVKADMRRLVESRLLCRHLHAVLRIVHQGVDQARRHVRGCVQTQARVVRFTPDDLLAPIAQ